MDQTRSTMVVEEGLLMDQNKGTMGMEEGSSRVVVKRVRKIKNGCKKVEHQPRSSLQVTGGKAKEPFF